MALHTFEGMPPRRPSTHELVRRSRGAIRRSGVAIRKLEEALDHARSYLARSAAPDGTAPAPLGSDTAIRTVPES